MVSEEGLTSLPEIKNLLFVIRLRLLSVLLGLRLRVFLGLGLGVSLRFLRLLR